MVRWYTDAIKSRAETFADWGKIDPGLSGDSGNDWRILGIGINLVLFKGKKGIGIILEAHHLRRFVAVFRDLFLACAKCIGTLGHANTFAGQIPDGMEATFARVKNLAGPEIWRNSPHDRHCTRQLR